MIIQAPIKEKEIQNLIFLDTESELIQQTDEKGNRIEIHKPYLLCLRMYSDYDTPITGYLFFYTVVEFNQWLLMTIRERKNITLIAHNMKYDSLIINALTFLAENNFKIDSFSFANPFFIFAGNKQKRYKITYISSTNIFQQSLASLGEALGLPKLDYEYYGSPDLEKAKPYCKRDVEILEKTMLNYFKFLTNELKVYQHKITIASQSFNVFVTKFMEHDIDIHNFEKVIESERKSYKGGRTECFRLGKFENLWYYDINSMYPYVMRYMKFPSRYIRTAKIIGIEDVRREIANGNLIIADCFVNTDTPVFAHKQEDKLIFPVGKYRETLSTPEIIYGLDHGLIEGIVNAHIYEGADLFSSFINFFYDKRLEAKADKNKLFELFYKIFMNSLYGKFGQRLIVWECVDEIDDVFLMKEYIDIIEEDGTSRAVLRKVFNGQVWEKEDKGNARSAFVAIAAHVTAYARMEWWRFAECAGLQNVYYGDTDSLMVNEEGSKKLVAAGHVDKKELGKLKEEGHIKTIHIRNLKDYSLEMYPDENGKIETLNKKKGLPKNHKVIAENCYEVTHWNGYAKFIKLGNDQCYFTEIRQKQYSGKYNKGTVFGNTIKPIRLEEWK